MDFVMILQLLIVLGALYVGSCYGSLALGAISGIGLAIFVLGFGMSVCAFVSFFVVCFIRLLAVRYHISLPILRAEE